MALRETLIALDAGTKLAHSDYWRELVQAQLAGIERYGAMFTRYRSEVVNLSTLKFAPFHLLATEGQTYFDRSHLWHMQTMSRLARSGDGFVIPTRYEIVQTGDEKAWKKTLDWWEELSADSREGFVVKPLPFVPRGRRGFAQPALKCRSREHLRLVYGPTYDSHDARELLSAREALRNRRSKHRRVLRQFALSMEAVDRFVKRSPMSAVHECVLGVLAQEVSPTMSH